MTIEIRLFHLIEVHIIALRVLLIILICLVRRIWLWIS